MLTSTLEPALIGNRVIALVGLATGRTTVYGLVTFGGLLVASVTQPVIGALSDHARARTPYIIAGVLTSMAGLVVVALSPSLSILVAGLVLLQLGNNTALASWQPLIATEIPERQRGLAAGIKALFDLVGAIAGRLAAGEWVAHYSDWGTSALAGALALPAMGLLITLGLVVAYLRRRTPGPRAPPHALTWQAALRQSFVIDWRAHPAFVRWCINRVLFWCAFIASSVFLLFFSVDGLGMSEAEAQRYIGRLVVLLGAAVALVIVPAGRLADKLGRRPMMIVGGLLAAIGAALVVAWRGQTIIASIVIGVGVGLYLSSSLAMINDIVPVSSAARYLGVANIATVAGSAVARLAGGFGVDAINRLTGTHEVGFVALYAAASALFFLSAAVMVVQHPSSKLPLDSPSMA